MRIPRTRKQAGDTIVEVLICIGVISVVLTGAFLVATRSSKGVQDSGEHGQAELLLQSQVELLRQYLQNSSAALPQSGLTYCMADAATLTVANASNCNTPYNTATFHAVLTPGSAADPNKYTFTVTWDSVRGGKASESYIYRVYRQS